MGRIEYQNKNGKYTRQHPLKMQKAHEMREMKFIDLSLK